MEITTQTLFDDDSMTSGLDIDDKFQCASRHTTSFLLFSLFPGIAILINLLVLAAVLRKAGKLMRQSHIYAHASSTLAGNLLFSTLSLFQIFSLYFNFGGHPNHVDSTQHGVVNKSNSEWWAFHKAFLCGMFVIMCGNISLLIDSIRHSTCSTLRTAAGHRVHARENGTKWKKKIFTRKQRSYLQITLLWTIPLIYVTVSSAVGWNCGQTCQCLSECFPSNYDYSTSNSSCSRLFPPMKNSWLSVVVISWLSGVVITMYLLKRSVGRVRKMWYQTSTTRRSEEKPSDGQTNDEIEFKDKRNQIAKLDRIIASKPSGGTESKLSDIEHNSSTSQPDDNSSSSNFERSDKENENERTNARKKDRVNKKRSRSVSPSGSLTQLPRPNVDKSKSSTLSNLRGNGAHRRVMEHLRNTKATTFSLRYVIYLTFSFVLCTSPTMILLTIDMLNQTLSLNMFVLNACLMCPFLYCYFCPFILVKCLPGVRKSLSALFLSVYSTSR